jgi:hypothetical protein
MRGPVRRTGFRRLQAVASALLLLTAVSPASSAQEVILKGGHVSLVAGANAIKRLWPKLDNWLGKRST